MFAGESDTYRDCCLIATARAIAAAADAAKVPFELVTYPKLPGTISSSVAATTIRSPIKTPSSGPPPA